MADMPALNATFFAFRKRTPGGVLLGAGIAFALAAILLVALFGASLFALLGGADFFQWWRDAVSTAANGDGQPPPPPNLAGIFLVFPLELVFLIVFFILMAAFESSCLRWMIRGERSGPLRLYFGADMWRVYGAYWMWFLFYVLSAIVFAILMLITGLAGGAMFGADNPAGPVLLMLVLCVVWIVSWICVVVRIAPAAATTIAIGEFAPLKAWNASRGRFWALFGSYLLLGFSQFVITMVVAAVAMGAFYAALFSQVDWSTISTDPEGFSRSYEKASLDAMRQLFSSPLTMALYFGGQVLLYVIGITFSVLFCGVNARAAQAAIEEGKITPAPASA